jgi:hypothetical protein
MDTELALSRMFNNVWPHLGERERRLVAASEARRIGRRGISMVSRACGLSRVTITKGIKELDEAPLAPGKVRRSGAGRPRVERVDPGIRTSLEALMLEDRDEPGPPSIIWTVKSTRRLAHELTAAQHRISHEKVAQILRQGGFNLQGTRRKEDGRQAPDRRAQFRHVDRRAAERLEEGQPVVAIETRRRESAYVSRPAVPAAHPAEPDRLLAGEHPAGIYDPRLGRDSVNVETALDPASFIVDSLAGWWSVEGQDLYPGAGCLLVVADGCAPAMRPGWRTQLRRLATSTGLSVEFCRLPPGTSKWNLPHLRLFSFLSSHWQGEAERDHEISARIVNPPDEARSMALGLRLDHARHRPPAEAGDPDLMMAAQDNVGEWNFTVHPETFGSYRPRTAFDNGRRPSVPM